MIANQIAAPARAPAITGEKSRAASMPSFTPSPTALVTGARA